MIRIVFLLLLLCTQQSYAQTDAAYIKEITTPATEFLRSLDPIQKRQAVLAFEDKERLKWNNLPVGMRARAGLNIGKMTDAQRKLFHRILSASLSSQGYLKATSIMHLDNLLNMYYDSLYVNKKIDSNTYRMITGLQWSHRNFYLAFFGQPTDSAWGYKVEGHHLSVNFTFSGGKLSVTPFFIGTDPAEFQSDEYAGWRVLGEEQDLGLKLVHSLTPDQQRKAILSQKVPADIFTAAESGVRLLDYTGVKVAELNAAQLTLVERIIKEFAFNMKYDRALAEFEKIKKAGLKNIYFAWIGPIDENAAHYFVLNGPTFLIEFDNYGFGGKANHIHAIWREKGNEYGEDLLRKHYQQNSH